MPAPQAMAESPTPFPCDSDFYQVVNSVHNQPFQGNFNRLYRLDPQTGSYALIQSNDIGPYNAISYNVQDNYIYGILVSNKNLMRIGADGIAENLGTVAGLPTQSIFVGAFDLDGNLYIRRGGSIYRIDVDASPPTASQINLKGGTVPNIADWGFIDISDTAHPERFLLAGVVSGGKDLVLFDFLDSTATSADTVTIRLTGDIADETGAFGANYPVSGARTEMFASNNNSGNIFRIVLDLDENDLSKSSALGVFTAIGTPTGSNDGASCALSASPFSDTVANNDSDTTPENSAVTTNVAANDTAVPGNSLVLSSLSILTNPSNGVAVQNGDGTIAYTPDANFNGTDSYTYQICNDAVPPVCDEATVTITVGSPNTPLTVQSGSDGGLESGPLPVPPSTFIGEIGQDPQSEVAAAQKAENLARHKARLRNVGSLTLADLLPETGPDGTVATPAIPVDVLAVTTAPDAKAVDFVDAQGTPQAVVLGIESLDGPYEHDYSVCNRFKGYLFDQIGALFVEDPLAPNGGSWVWRSLSHQGPSIHEEALIFHIFVDETNQKFHIDSRWVQDDYTQPFAYSFDYVFNMQVWSSDVATSADLFKSILNTLRGLDGGSWEVIYHNVTQPQAPQVFIESVRYEADVVHIEIRNLSDQDRDVRLYGTWRSHLDRNTLQPFEIEETVSPESTTYSLPLIGLLDVTLFLDSDGFTDKAYTGSGLWFPVQNSTSVEAEVAHGECRTLTSGFDSSDLLLAGCSKLVAKNVSQANEAGLGRTLSPNGRPVDVSPYHSVRFWARGDNRPVRLILESQSVTDGNHFQTIFTPGPNWQQFIIPLTEFTQEGSQTNSFVGTDVKALIWLNADQTNGHFELEIDQVSFTNNGQMALETGPVDTADSSAQPVEISVEDVASVQSAVLQISLDDGRTFRPIPMTASARAQESGAGVLLTAQIPGQPLGSDIRYYVEMEDSHGYVRYSPVDAPQSYYRYRVDDRQGLLVDDFGGPRLYNRLNGSNGLFNHPELGGYLTAYREAGELILDYNVSASEQYAGYFTGLGGLDMDQYKTLDILLRGENGSEHLLLGLKDLSGLEPKLSVADVAPGGITTEWRWVQIPLDAFARQIDLASVESLSLSFANSQSKAGGTEGRVSIREIRLTSLPAPTVIDTFEDGNDLSNGLGLPHWVSAPNGGLEARYVSQLRAGQATTALQLAAAIADGAYAIWNSDLGDLAAAADARLSFWARSAELTLSPNLYLQTSNGRYSVKLAGFASLSPSWQLVEIPLSVFAAQGADLSHLQAVQVVFEHEAGSGSLWLDDLMIATGSQVQAGRRTLHLRDQDSQSIALHASSGQAWRILSDTSWLQANSQGWGPQNLQIATFPLGLPVGQYTGHLTIGLEHQGRENLLETITVELTVSEEIPVRGKVYLPVVER